MNPESALLTGLLAGLFGSTHCLGMCGGIAGLLHAQVPANKPLLAGGFHLGRISSYLIIALLATAIGLLPATFMPEGGVGAMRIALGALIVVMAIGIALPGRLRDYAGELTAPLTRRLVPHLARFLPVKSLDQSLALGLLWGLLPCGLLYTVIAAAVLLADPLATIALVTAFGVGTIPMLLGTGMLALRFRSAINRRDLRNVAAGLMIVTGVLVAAGPWLAHVIDHPWMHFLADCVSPRH